MNAEQIAARIAALPPEKRRLLEKRLQQEGIDPARGGIPRADAAEHYPLTFGQQRLWFIEQLMPGTAAYNIPFAGRLVGRLETWALEASLNALVHRHAVLRSRFTKVDGQAVQQPIPPAALPHRPLRVVDLSGLSTERADAALERLSVAEGRFPFDLEAPPLVRLALLRMPLGAAAPGGTTDHFLMVTMPHLVTDAWSMAVFFEELPALYDERLPGRDQSTDSPLSALEIQVHDVAVWQRRRFSGARLEEEMAFWRTQLADAETVLELPTDRPRPARQSFRGARYAVRIPTALTAALDAIHRRHGVTPFMLYLAAFGVLLHRYSGQPDILVGSPVVTREQEATRRLIGFFINIAVLRLDLRPEPGAEEPTFLAFLERVKAMCLASFAHQEVPFEALVEAFWHQRTLARNPLAQVTFVLQNVGITHPEFDGLKLTHFRQTGTQTARDDLTLGFWEGNEAMSGWFEYPTDLFDESTIVRMGEHLIRLMEGIVEDPARPVGELPLLGAAERQALLRDWQAAPLGHPDDLGTLFLAQAERAPEASALLLPDGERLTYGALAARAVARAGVLREAGVGPEVAVPIVLPPGPELIIEILATVLAGGFYVPLDPEDPPERRERLLGVLEGREPSPPQSPSPKGRGGSPDHLAYLLFTSGSTGEPKGVAVPHRAVVRLLRGLQTPRPVLRLGPGEVILQRAPVAFDASTLEIWGALATGGALALPRSSRVALPELAREIEEYGVTTLWLTAGLFHLAVETIPEALARVPQLLAGGDILAAPTVRRALERSPVVINGYGPTEATTFTTCRRFETGDEVPDNVPLGLPLGGTRVVVVDPGMGWRLQPIGVPGELLLGGEGLARGYFQRPGATADAFRPDPFAGAGGEAGGRLYRSGDRGRRLANGESEFLGRLDRQVKVRGFRVEPGEVEAALLALPTVAAAAVEPLPSPGGVGLRLVAFVATGEGTETSEEALKARLAATLPEALIPTRLLLLPELPLTANGKIDRAALVTLLDAEQSPLASGDDAPRDAVEATLAAVWAALLGVERVGIHDDWFTLGGDSILSIQALSRAAEAGIHLEAQDVFTHPTIAALAQRARVEAATASPMGAAAEPGPVPLTPVQRWFFDLPLPHPEQWNLALWVGLPTPRSVDGLRAAAARLVARHDALRLAFRTTAEGAVRQILHPQGAAPTVEHLDLTSADPATVEDRLEAAADRLQQGFDLADREGSALLRLLLAELPEGGQRLLLVVHHLVADTVSCGLLVEELLAEELLAEEAPAVESLTAPSFAAWARRSAGEAPAEAAPVSAPLNAGASLPLDDPEGDGREGAARQHRFTLAAESTEALYQQAGAAYGTRPDELLLTALAEAVATVGVEGPFALCREGHGREGGLQGENLARAVGWFTILERVVLDLSTVAWGDDGGTLTAIKEQLRRPTLPGDASLQGVTVSFNHLGRLDRLVAAGGGELLDTPVGALHHPDGTRPFPLEILVYALGGALHTVWRYDARLRRETVEPLAAAFIERATALIDHCLDPAAGRFTPSDFPQVAVSQGELDRLTARFAKDRTEDDP